MNPTASKSTTLVFGVFQLDVAHNELKKFGIPIRLQPQPFSLLVLLASRSGEVVTREEIHEQLWGSNVFVDFERGLNHCIRQIRAALDDDASAPRYIQTVPRSGYRFIAPVRMAIAEPPAAEVSTPPDATGGTDQAAAANTPRTRWHPKRFLALAAVMAALLASHWLFLYKWRKTHPAQPSPRLMLAVLPFENLTGDPGQDYLSDGMTDEMIVHLDRISPVHLGVIARTSSMSYKRSGKPLAQISRELGVQYFLEGTLKRSGQDVRITATLVRSDDQTQLWADTYDGQVSGQRILAFQQSVADRVAQSLSLVLPEVRTVRRTTASQGAYEAFLKGRYECNERNEEGFLNAIEYFQNALVYDPDYAQAYIGLADSYNLMREYYEGRSSDRTAQLGKDAALKALTLDPTLSEARASLAFNLWRYEWKFPQAQTEFRQALDLNPNNATAHHWFGMFLASRGRFEEARKELRQARSLDPLSLIIITNLGWVDYYAHDYTAAIASYQEALRLNGSFQPALMKLAWAYEQEAKWQEALDARQRFYVAAGHPEIAQALSRAYATSGYPGVLGAIVAETGKPDAGPYYPDYEKAKLYAMIGDADKVLELLQRATDHHSGWLVYLGVEPAFAHLRSDARFARLVDQTISARPL
jgi:TolB-like protein/DNA-binding winged helix-turn-helix (wHTH) protein/tetratricopeptide (TPR) repeat protein